MVERVKAIAAGLYLFLLNRKGFVIFCLSKISIAVLNMLITIIIARKVSVEGFGKYSLVLMVVGLAITFGFSWSSSSILYYGSREKAKSGNLNKVFWVRNVILLFSLLSVTILFILISTRLNEYIGENLSFLILGWIYIKVIEDFLTQYFLATKKQILCNLMLITARLLFLMLLLVASYGVKKLIYMNIASDMVVLVYIYFIGRKDIGRFEFEKEIFKEILAFSLWQLIGFSGLYIINFGDIAVIKYFMTAKEVGIYNSAYRLFHGIAGLSYVISSYYTASVASYLEKDEKVALKRFFYKERLIIYGASLLLNIAAIIFARPLIRLLYGENYIASIPIFRVLMLGCIFKYADVFYMLYCNLLKKYSFVQGVNIAQSIMNLMLDIVFIKWFGLIGPAIATSLSIVVTVLYTFVYCENHVSSLCGHEIFNCRAMAKQK